MSPRQPQQLALHLDNEVRTLRDSLGLSQQEVADLTDCCLRTVKRWESGAKPKKIVVEYLRALLYQRSTLNLQKASGVRFIDLFAGIGGMRRGFESIGATCVYTSEWDKFAVQTYKANFDCSHGIAGDITKVKAKDIPTHDVLLAGFPCQPFSIAGVSKKNSLGRPHGFACDTQGTLFYDVVRILQHHRPPAFLLENVKSLTSHDGGRTFATIQHVLRVELGYHLHTKIIDGRAFVPQHRERIYLVGFRDDNDFNWNRLVLPPESMHPKLGSILHPEDGSEIAEPRFTDPDGKVSSDFILSQHLWRYLQDYAAKHKAAGNGFGFGLVGKNDVARTLSQRYYKDGSEILISRGKRARPRKLTPRECARLMGFDRAGSEPFKIPVSNTQAYRQFGNSVVVPVIEAVATLMKPYIISEPAPALDLARTG